MQCLFELCTPRTHGAPDSEREKTNKQKNKHHIFALTALQHCAIFPKLCVVIELVVPIIKGVIHFLIQHIVFSYRVHGKSWPNLQTRGFSAITP